MYGNSCRLGNYSSLSNRQESVGGAFPPIPTPPQGNAAAQCGVSDSWAAANKKGGVPVPAAAFFVAGAQR